MIGLKRGNLTPQRFPQLSQGVVDVCQCARPVNTWLALAEQIQVGAVQNEN
jgi:hypothetical protein